MKQHTCSRRAMLKTLGAGTLASFAIPSLSLVAEETRGRLKEYPWLNQISGPRPRFVWENCEDLIYHDLSYTDPAVESAPEFCAFMRRVWVFNRAMQWRRDELTGTILCYSAAGDLPLTGEQQVSAWHSDPENVIDHRGQTTRFVKKSSRRRRDCAVLPAFQFHLGQHPKLAVKVSEATADWQLCISVKGRSGAPLLASPWCQGPAEVTFDIAAELARRGYRNSYAELHFVMGLWCSDARNEGSVTFEARLNGQSAVVPCLPIIRTAATATEGSVPLAAVVVGADGRLLDAPDKVRVFVRVAGKKVPLFAHERVWKGYVRYLKPGNYDAEVVAEGAVSSRSPLQIRITDGEFDTFDRSRRVIRRKGEPVGPLTGSYQGTFFFRDAGTSRERMLNGQAAWDSWNRSEPPGEHQHYWEALTEQELDERFTYLAKCGWDLLHLNQHWGVWERLDAGGRIAPHGAEQLALYLRAAERHGLKSFFALTHYPYSLHQSGRRVVGTVPYSAYVDAGFQDADWFQVGNQPFDQMFRQYVSDFLGLFREETALFAMTASGEGDCAIGPRVHDIHRQARSLDAHHIFAAEPIHSMRKLPRAHCAGWEQDMFGFRTYSLGANHWAEIDLGVEYKFAQMGPLYLGEGSFAASPRYVKFRNDLDGRSGAPASWTGTLRYRTRLRDTLYLGLVHRIPVLMLWDEQVAEDEHRLFKRIVQSVNWRQPWMEPPVAVRVDDSHAAGDGRGKLARLERAFAEMPLAWQLIEANAPAPAGVEAVIDARSPYQAPSFADIGGVLPLELKARMPLRITGNYWASYLWSADRETLLAYVYNTTHHVQLESNHDLAGRFHRLPDEEELRLGLRNLAAGRLHYQIFDLSDQVLAREGYVIGGSDLDLGRTAKDFFVLVTPR